MQEASTDSPGSVPGF